MPRFVILPIPCASYNNKSFVQTMFAHPTDDYDFVVQLDPKLLPRYFQNVSVDLSVLSGHVHYANLQDESDEPLRPGFDPARLLFDDLKVHFTSSCSQNAEK